MTVHNSPSISGLRGVGLEMGDSFFCCLGYGMWVRDAMLSTFFLFEPVPGGIIDMIGNH